MRALALLLALTAAAAATSSLVRLHALAGLLLIRPASAQDAARDVAPPASTVRIFIHYPRHSAQGRRLAAETGVVLSSAGYEVVDLRAVDFLVARPRVRFFFDADAAAAAEIAERFHRYLAGATDVRGSVAVEDFTRYQPLPAPGNVEVWIPSSTRASLP